MMFTRRTLLVTLTLLASLNPARSDPSGEWPQKPIRIIFPYAAGGVDGWARVITQRVGDALGQPIIIESRPGANGAMAAEAVARSPADGYTLFWAITPQICIFPAMTKVPYDPVRDFAPISAIGTTPFVLIVNKDLPVKTVREFVEYVRGQPNRLAYAEGGVGSVSHLAMELFLRRAGLAMTNVSYKGNVPALTDVIAGHLSSMFTTLPTALEQATSGTIRMLAVSSEARDPRLPNIPTIGESGFPGFRAVSWHGLMAPARTPKPVIDRIAAEVARTVRDANVTDRLVALGVAPIGNSSSEFAAMIAADMPLWAEAVKIAGVEMR